SSKHHVRVTEASTTKSTSATAGLDQLTDPYVPQGVAAAVLPEGRDHLCPIAPPGLCRNEHGDWYPMLRDSEGAPGGDFVQQPRKVRLGFVGPHSLHEIRLVSDQSVVKALPCGGMRAIREGDGLRRVDAPTAAFLTELYS